MNHQTVYEIVIHGHLDEGEAEWFGGTVEQKEGGTTHLVVVLADQAALHGVINRIFGLGLVLLAVRALEPRGAGNR